jgi:ABC-2 type transport system ATP-binding protein
VTPALEADHVSKRYRRRGPPALDAVDLALEPCGIAALVGPNGAGKSTLIRAWAGLEEPTAGRVRVLGVDAWRHRRRAVALLGYVPQAPTLYRSLTVREHIALAEAIRPGFDVDYAISRLRLLAVPLQSTGAELSGGQQAQVGLAIALGTRAPVLVLDEPLATLDPVSRREFLHLLRDSVAETGATCLLSSHVVSDIAEACDRIVVLGIGRKLLDEDLGWAIRRHWITLNREQELRIRDLTHVSEFVAADRSTLRLGVRGAAAPAQHHDGSGRPATLEEIVVGYLSLARQQSVVQ